MPVIQCCQVGRVKLSNLQLNRKVASEQVRSPGPEVSCKLIGCLPDVRPPLQQWGGHRIGLLRNDSYK